MSTPVWEYRRSWPIYAIGFKNCDISWRGRPHAVIAVGSFLTHELENRIDIIAVPKEIETDGNAGRTRWAKLDVVQVCQFAHPYPASKIVWRPFVSPPDGPPDASGDSKNSDHHNYFATVGFNLRLYRFDFDENNCVANVREECSFRTENACLALDWHTEPDKVGKIVTCGMHGGDCTGSNLVVWDLDKALSKEAAKEFTLQQGEELARQDIYDVAFIPGTMGKSLLCACRDGSGASAIWRVSADGSETSWKIWESQTERINQLRWCPARAARAGKDEHRMFSFLSTGSEDGSHGVHLHRHGRESFPNHGNDMVYPHRLPEQSRALAWYPWAAGDDPDRLTLFRFCTVGESSQHLTIWSVQEPVDNVPDPQHIYREFTLALPTASTADNDYVSNVQWSHASFGWVGGELTASEREADLVALAFTYKLQVINLRTCPSK